MGRPNSPNTNSVDTQQTYNTNTMNIIQEQNKARILRETATRVEGKDFDWSKTRECVIGNMAQIAGVKRNEIEVNLGSSWSRHALDVETCSSTGLPLDKVLATLYSLGFTAADVRRAELGDQSICVVTSSESSQSIAQRLRDWADEIDRAILVEQSAIKQPEQVQQRAVI